jgi:hypothetical protein
MVTKHLDVNTKGPKVFLCCNFANGIIEEEEVEPELFIITLPKSSTLVSYVALETSLEFKFD